MKMTCSVCSLRARLCFICNSSPVQKVIVLQEHLLNKNKNIFLTNRQVGKKCSPGEIQENTTCLRASLFIFEVFLMPPLHSVAAGEWSKMFPLQYDFSSVFSWRDANKPSNWLMSLQCCRSSTNMMLEVWLVSFRWEWAEAECLEQGTCWVIGSVLLRNAKECACYSRTLNICIEKIEILLWKCCVLMRQCKW